MKNKINKLIKLLIAVLVLVLVFASVSLAVPFHPDIVEKYRAEGKLDELAKREQKLNEFTMNNFGSRYGSFPTEGDNKLLVIMIEYPNLEFDSDSTPEFYEELLNGEDEDDHSMARYYRDMSNGKFELEIDVAGTYMADNNYQYYSDYQYTRELIAEAIEKANDDVRYSNYDNDDNGKVDAILVIHAGPGAESMGGSYIHSHQSSLYDIYLNLDGVTFDDYSIQPEYVYDPGDSTIGVFAHEFGHLMGLPDLYDTTYESDGVGRWSIMASGSWSGIENAGDRPPPFLAWEKDRLGWLNILEADLTKNPNLAKTEKNNNKVNNIPIVFSWGLLALLGLVLSLFVGIKAKKKNLSLLFLFLFLFILPTMITVYGCSNLVRVNITITPENTGSVILLPDGSFIFKPGEQANMIAVPEYGWKFKEWRDDISGTENPSSINIDTNKNVTAAFEEGASLLDIDYSYSAIKVRMSSTEYLLLENKVTEDSDLWSTTLPGGGMLITHIDNIIINEHMGSNQVNSDEDHGVRIVEADDNDELFTSGHPNPSGEPTDTFYEGNNDSITPDTSPSTNLNDGTPTGISITNISDKGFEMTFDATTE